MDRIVLGFDGSPSAIAALVWATQQARLHAAGLIVVSVLDSNLDEPSSVFLHAELHSHIEHAASGLTCEHRFEHGGSPAAHLVNACRSGDQLVVGARGQHRIGDRLGSVSRACIAAAPCPVVVLHERPVRTDGAVVVAVDGSPESARALRCGADEAHRRAAQLRAVLVVQMDSLGLSLPTRIQRVEWAKSVLEQTLTDNGIVATATVAIGRPVDVLVDMTADAVLLVLGARGQPPLSALVPGSTAAQCIHRVACPVMVVPTMPERIRKRDSTVVSADRPEGSLRTR